MSRKLRGEQTSLNTSGFVGVLSGADDNLQTAMSTIDTHVQEVVYGGTGLTSIPDTGSLIYVRSPNTLDELVPGTDGYVLKLNTGIPTWEPEFSGGLLGSGSYQQISLWKDSTNVSGDGYYLYDEVNKTQISKSLLTDAYVGAELISNGNFSSGSASWTSTNPPFTFASNRADKAAGTSGNLSQTIVYSTNTTYLISLTVYTSVAGVVNVTFGGASSIEIGKTIGVNIYTFVLTPTTAANFAIVCDSGYAGYFDNVSVKRIYESKPVILTKSHNNLNTGEVRFGGINDWTRLYNSAIGLDALKYNISGTKNAAFGYNALNQNYSGSYNTAIGVEALTSCGSANGNSALGYRALSVNSVGSYNTAVGYLSLSYLFGGTSNTAVGYGVLSSSEYCNYNVGVGRQVLERTSGDYNIGIGISSLAALTTGSYNIGIGLDVLSTTSSPSYNTIVGNSSAVAITDGQYNTGIGASSLRAITDSSNNAYLGYQVLQAMTSGTENLAIGNGALKSVITCDYNTAVGAKAMGSGAGSDVDKNTAVGYSSLYVTTGTNNIAIGYGTGVAIVSSLENSIGGYLSMEHATDGYSCSTYGAYALNAMTTCRKNTAIGHGAMQNATYGGFGEGTVEYGADCTAVGYRAFYGATSYYKAGAFGAYAEPGGNKQIRIGDNDITVHVQNAVSVDSDERVKDNIENINIGLDFIKDLMPRSYKYKDTIRQLPDGEILKYTYKRNHWGFIAQEVKQVMDKYNIDSGVYVDSAYDGGVDLKGLRYEELIAPIVKAIQEQQVIIEDLRKEILELKNK